MRNFVLISILLIVISLNGIPNPSMGEIPENYLPTRGSTYIVAKDGTGDYISIQDAVDASSTGDTVRVFDGVYKEAVMIGDSIDLIGNGTSRTILDGDGTLDHKHLFQINSPDVNVTGFQFREGSPHHEFAGIGIYSSNVLVKGNLFFDNNIGIYIAGGPDNIVVNNTFDQNIYGIRSDAGCDGNLILNNTFNSSSSAGVIYFWARNVTINGNNFTGNEYHLGLFNSNEYDIGDNRFFDADPGRSGLMIGTSIKNRIHNNTFLSNDAGIGFSSGADQNYIMDNIFRENKEGIRAYSNVNNVEVHWNSFINNSAFGINCSASSSSINATLNWWGNFTGPHDPVSNPNGTGDNVTVNVTYFPWLLGEWTNNPPVLDEIGTVHATEDDTFSLKPDASDPDDHEILFRFETNASWIQMNARNMSLEGIPRNPDVGRFFILINVSDGMGGFDEENVTLIVNNTPPEILSEELPYGVEDEPYDFHMEYVREEGAYWNCTTNASWLTFDDINIRFYGMPGNDDVGSYWIHLFMNDGNGGYDDVNLSLNVIGVDDPPYFGEALENIEMDEDSIYFLDLSNWIIDIDDEITSYSYSGKGNITVVFDLESRSSEINPSENWSGYEMVNFTAHLDEEMMFQTIMITVNEINDDPYNISSVVEPSSNETFWLNGSAEDPDLIYGDELKYNWSSNVSGEIGTGNSIEVALAEGHHLITLNVSDLAGAWVMDSIELIVTSPSNDTEVPDNNDTGPDDNDTEPEDPADDDLPEDDDDQPADDDTDSDDVDSNDDESGDDDDIGILVPIMVSVALIFLAVIVISFILVRRSREEVMDWEE